MDTMLLFPLILTLLIGLVLGYALAYFGLRMRWQRDWAPRAELDERYVARAVHDQLQQQLDLLHDNLEEKRATERDLTAQLAAQTAEHRHLATQLQGQQTEMERLQAEARAHFERVATALLDEKSEKFAHQNQQQLGHLLTPLRQQLQTFEEQIERRFLDETRDRINLKKEIEQLSLLNQQLSTDASSLASALKGDNKVQGDWGEWQLERLLQYAGLERDLHYRTQVTLQDADGRAKRPDFIIDLPEERQLIIDCKVSLTAYERYCRCDNDGERTQHLRDHVTSLRRHLRDLQSKNYTQLYALNSPDYLLLYVPLEPALHLALHHDQQLLTDALDHNIMLVTTSTLTTTLRTVSYLWRQEKQQRNAQEIAYQSGLLYDKFVGFVSDLEGIGQRLDQAQTSYHDALNKLYRSGKYGDTLVGRAERLRDLGAKNNKLLGAEYRRTEEESR